jgi:hypothetical protein
MVRDERDRVNKRCTREVHTMSGGVRKCGARTIDGSQLCPFHEEGATEDAYRERGGP